MFYLILYVLLSLILFLSAYYKARRNYFIFLFFLIIFLVSGLRGDVGQDTFNYQMHYEYLKDTNTFLNLIKTREPILYIIMLVQKSIYNSYTGFLLVIAFIQAYLLYYSTKHLYHRSFFLFFYILIFFFEFHLNVLRSGLSVLFFLCSLATINNNRKQGYLFLLLSLLSHISIIVLVPIIISRMNISLRTLLNIIVSSLLIFILVYFLFGDLILLKIEGYNLLDFTNARLPKVVFTLLLIAWFSYFFSDKVSSDIRVALFIFSLFYLYSGVSDLAYRFYYISAACLLYLISEKKHMIINKMKFKPVNLGVICILLFFSFHNINNTINEKDRRIETGNGKVDFTYVPYSMFYSSEYR